jgi:hypothetical protein
MPRSSMLSADISCFTHILTAFWHVTLPNFELVSEVSEKDYGSFFRVDLKTDATKGHVQQDESATIVAVRLSDLILAMRATYLPYSSLTNLLTCVCSSATNICQVPINIMVHCGSCNQCFYTFCYPLFRHFSTFKLWQMCLCNCICSRCVYFIKLPVAQDVLRRWADASFCDSNAQLGPKPAQCWGC